MLLCIIWTVLVSILRSHANDLANQKYTAGTQVVEHVLDVISHFCLLDSRLFLRRMAYVESRDGTLPSTYRAGHYGGIWNISEMMLKNTQNQSNLQAEYNVIKNNLFIDWSKVNWEELRVPLKSGLAAALYVRSLNIRSLPDSLEIQASIWGSLKPDNQASSFYMDVNNVVTECAFKEELDIIIAMDFTQLVPVDLARLQMFLQTFLKSFRLSQNETRVGLVTKKLMPKAGWYLDSDRPDFTLLDALKALTYTPGPTFTGDILEFIRLNMFNSTKGARSTAARTVLLLTDGITQYSYAEAEARNLADAGISLFIIEVDEIGNSTSKDQLLRLTKGLGCDSVLVVRTFSDLEKTSEGIKQSLCNAPVMLKPGKYMYSCPEIINLQITDPSDTSSIQVVTSSGDVDIFASLIYTRPDKAGYDVMMTSTSLSSPVLFLRGIEPVYITIQKASRKYNCSGHFEIEIKRGETFTGVNGTCFIGGVVRNCNALAMSMAAHDIVLIRDPSPLSLCNYASHTTEYFPHATDVQKFIMCDQNRNQYIGLCPVNQTNCIQFTSGCKYSNPCSPDAMLKKDLYFVDPCAESERYIQCSHLGIAEVLYCGERKFWNPDTKACVYKYVHNVFLGTENSNISNPCLHSTADHVYFPYPHEPTKYIFCDSKGNAFESACHGELWNQQTRTCIKSSPQFVTVG